MLHPNSQKFPQYCLWNNGNVPLIFITLKKIVKALPLSTASLLKAIDSLMSLAFCPHVVSSSSALYVFWDTIIAIVMPCSFPLTPACPGHGEYCWQNAIKDANVAALYYRYTVCSGTYMLQWTLNRPALHTLWPFSENVYSRTRLLQAVVNKSKLHDWPSIVQLIVAQPASLTRKRGQIDVLN